MPDDFTKGYESTRPEDANAPNRPSRQHYDPPGTMAEAVKKRWKDAPTPYPWGKNTEGGAG